MNTKGRQTLKQELVEKDRKYVWHHMSPHNDDPTIFVSGEGSWITDVDGNRFLDAMSGLWCVNVGHGRTEIAQRAYEQMKTLAYSLPTQAHEPAVRLAEKISDWLDGDYRIFFSNSGSEANEVAFKIIRQYYHQKGESTRFKFISRYRGYHGNSMGALGATGQASRKVKYEPLGTGFVHVPPPYCYRCPFGQTYGSCRFECAKAFDDTINHEGAESVAGVILEPVITGGGMIVPPPEYLPMVRDICDKYGVMLIVDEVICGMGRSGRRFGHQNFGVKPDVVTMAKGLTSAYSPLSATAVRADMYESFKEKGVTSHFRHVNTFGGNPVSCAVGLENMDILEREDLVERSAWLGEELRKRLQVLSGDPHVGEIRYFGSACGIELVEDRVTKEPASSDKVLKIIQSCKQRGLLIMRNGETVPGFANILTIAPPFVTTADELDFIAEVLQGAIAQF